VLVLINYSQSIIELLDNKYFIPGMVKHAKGIVDFFSKSTIHE